jgi:hypothetical protein
MLSKLPDPVNVKPKDEIQVYMVVVNSNNNVVMSRWVGSNLLATKLEMLALTEGFPIEEIDPTVVITNALTRVFATKHKEFASAFLLSSFEVDFESMEHIYDALNGSNGSISTRNGLTFNFVVQY